MGMTGNQSARESSSQLKPNLTQAQTNHLRRLLAWVRGEVGQTPQEMVETLRGLGPMPDPSAEAKARLVDSYKRAEAVPKYVRTAVKALEKLLADPNTTRTTLGSNALWQLALLEMWLQHHGV